MVITHICFSLLFSLVLNLDAFYVVIGSIIPDFDYLLFTRNMHRKLLHNIFVGLIILLFAFYLHSVSLIYIFIGFITHIFLDMFTMYGVYLLWPFFNKRYKLFKRGIKNRSIYDYLFFFLSLIATIFIKIVK